MIYNLDAPLHGLDVLLRVAGERDEVRALFGQTVDLLCGRALDELFQRSPPHTCVPRDADNLAAPLALPFPVSYLRAGEGGEQQAPRLQGDGRPL